MTVTDNPIRNGVDTATLFATLDAVQGTPEIAKFQFRATQRVGQRHAQPVDDRTASTAPCRSWTHHQPFTYDADHPAVLVGQDNGPDARWSSCCTPSPPASPPASPTSPPPAGVNLESVRVDRRGRHRPARHPRPVRRGPQRLRADQGQLHAPGRRPREARRRRRAVPPALRRLRRADQRRPRLHRRRRRLTRPAPTVRPAHPPPVGPGGPPPQGAHPMPSTHTLVIGAGQAGLAMSRCLTDAGVDHVVLERGRIAERWRSERWDSLRLLTPNWASRLPGWSYRGPDPDGFMTAAELAGLPRGPTPGRSTRPSRSAAPVCGVARSGDGFTVRTPDDHLARARNVVHRHGLVRPAPRARPCAARLAARRRPGHTRAPTATPARCPTGGCSSSAPPPPASRSPTSCSRPAATSCSPSARHSRVPRRYRGMDIWWWLDRIGTFATTIDDVRDPLAGAATRARCSSSAARTGATSTSPRCSASVCGSPAASRRSTATTPRSPTTWPTPSPPPTSGSRRLLDQVDDHIAATGSPPRCSPASGLARLGPVTPTTRLDLRGEGIGAVVWATGYRRTYPWLHVPVLDRHGEILHRRGVTPVPGLYVLGQRFQHRRDSNFIDGVRHDADAPVPAHRRPAPPPRRRGLDPRKEPPDMNPSTATRHDVIVVGARAAGAATAMLLARAGLDVLVVDRGRYGADTLSTHAILRGGVLQLHRWGLLDEIVAAGTPAIRRTTFHYADRPGLRHGEAVARHRRALRPPAHGPRRRARRRGAPQRGRPSTTGRASRA